MIYTRLMSAEWTEPGRCCPPFVCRSLTHGLSLICIYVEARRGTHSFVHLLALSE